MLLSVCLAEVVSWSLEEGCRGGIFMAVEIAYFFTKGQMKQVKNLKRMSSHNF